MNMRNIKKLMVFLVFILACIFSTVSFSSYIQASGLDIYFPEAITLENTAITLDFDIVNTTNFTQEYEFNAYTSPFLSEINPSSVILQPNASQTIKFTINPIINSLKNVYFSSFEISTENSKKIYSFRIVQNDNRVCNINLDYNISYDSNSDLYNLDIILDNNYPQTSQIKLKSLTDSTNFKENTYDVDNSLVLNYKIDSDKEKTDLIYVCNNKEYLEQIKLIEKNKPKESLEVVKYLSGYFSFSKIKNFFNSLGFKIFLIIILIFLVISFTAKYVRYIYFKKHKGDL
ncbi:MAG: hypothetical protein PHR26_02400 [Candidatus ainarchaeum sp.]|nr:hypothetical protein [Candidatus ainarchaeum sp.]MDD3975909.1 hypothetical protein [Candidatus ainarchaeum sp.]